MEASKWCPQHGYPLPCAKCGLGEFERGKLAGIKEVVEWLRQHYVVRPDEDSISQFAPYYMISIPDVESKLKEWGLGNG